MKQEDVIIEAQEIEKELKEGVTEFRKTRTPLYYILAVFLVLLIVLMIVPYYRIRLDPVPSRIPTIKEVVPDWDYGNETKTIYDELDVMSVKIVADKIAVISCKGEKVCQAKAVYYYIRDNYEYVSDPIDKEYVENEKEFLSIGGGDCESGSIAMAALMEAIGIDAQLVLVPGHAFVRIKLEEAIEGYKVNGWINLDWTCKKCSFGETPYNTAKASYVEV